MIERESFPMTTETGNQAIVTGKPGMSDEAKKAVAKIVDAAAADMNRPVDRVVMPEPNEIVAIRAIDNWDGEKNIVTLLAYIDQFEQWRCYENGNAIMEYEGDKLLEWWPLKPGTGNKSA